MANSRGTVHSRGTVYSGGTGLWPVASPAPHGSTDMQAPQLKSSGSRANPYSGVGLAASAILAALSILSAATAADRDADAPANAHTPITLDLEPTAADLGVAAGQFAENAARLLATHETTGRFPTAIAIARIAPQSAGGGGPRTLQLVDISGPQAVRWNELLDDSPAIREMVLSGRFGLPRRELTARDLAQAAAQLKCALCFVYATSGDAVENFQAWGVLWDAIELRPIATMHAAAQADLLEYERAIEETPLDAAECRAEWRALRMFERQLLDAVAELVTRDRPAASTQPSPWINDRTLEPRDLWPLYRQYLRP